MKHLLLLAATALLLAVNTGCFHHALHRPHHGGASAGCAGAGCVDAHCGCACYGGGLLGGALHGNAAHACQETQGWRHQRPQLGPEGPPVGTYAYPYYTLHGPRDFLVDNPPSLGN